MWSKYFRRNALGMSLLIPVLFASCSSHDSQPPVVAQARETIVGRVIGAGHIEGALVCHDQNANGRCDPDETQALSDANGNYTIEIVKTADAMLLAEITSGRARDTAELGTTTDRSFRMVSAYQYSTHISPFSTIVSLANEKDFLLAEDEARNTLGLPPGFGIRLTSAAADGSRTQSVASAIIEALKSLGSEFDYTAAEAGTKVVAAFPSALTNLPQLRIETQQSAPIVSKEIYLNATFSLTDPLGTSGAVSLNGKIRGRGNTTWGQPKNPYKVQFTNDSNYSKLPDILGMKKNTNWALLADYFDRTLIRNKLALSLGSSSLFADGLKWTPSGQHLEVYLNGRYIGVYLLTEDIRIDPNRLDIKKMSSAPTVNDLDGGYIVEVDFRLDCFFNEAIDLRHYTPRLIPFCIKKPDEDSITKSQITYIHSLLDNIENDIYESSNISRLNLSSFADWYIIQELFRNIDAAFNSSDYMWIDTAAAPRPSDRLLNMGPLWDFDRSAGNVNDQEGWLPQGCWVNNSSLRPNWMSPLMNNPDFRALVLLRWKNKRQSLAKYVNTGIDTFSHRLQAAQLRNFEAWPILGIPLVSHYSFASYSEELAFLKSFLNQRMDWLDQAFASTESFDALCK